MNRHSSAASNTAVTITHVPVVREILVDLDTPLSAYLKLTRNGAARSFLLESVQGGERWGRYSIIGLPARREIRFRENVWREFVGGELVNEKHCVDPLAETRRYAARYQVPEITGLPRFAGGLVGYFGAELIRYVEPRLGMNKRPAEGLDDIRLLLAEDLVIFDNLRGTAFLITHRRSDEKKEIAEARLDATADALRAPPPAREAVPVTNNGFESVFGQQAYEDAVERVRDYIIDGDVMQVVLSQRLDTDFSGRPIDVYRALRTLNPSPYLYFLDFGDVQIAGSSPEALVRVEERELTVRPIAGTRRRGETKAEDLQLEQELRADPKELAEHLMLVDLGRNDVGRVSEVGSVRLTENMIAERYSHVMHLVSNVTGRLRDDIDALDALAACFPAGTLSGAPKLRALEIIDELEPAPRGIYSGAVGYLGWQGNMDVAIAIRTAVMRAGRLEVQAGAGIVHDSDPRSEWEETMNKSRALLQAVELVANEMNLQANLGGGE